MRIGIVHGYGLTGSASDLHVGRLCEHLARHEAQVHVLCQERAALLPPWVVDRTFHGPDGAVQRTVPNATAAPDAAVHVHVPHLGPVLPICSDGGSSDRSQGLGFVAEMPDLDDAALERYLVFATAALETVVRDHDLQVLHAPDGVAMSEVSRRAAGRTGRPFLVTAPGPALEHAVRQDPRAYAMARRGLDACAGVLLDAPETEARLRLVFGGDVFDAVDPIVLPAGVDLGLFTPRTAARGRPPSLPPSDGRGATATLMAELFETVRGDGVQGASERLLESVDDTRSRYARHHPDADLRTRLERVRWEQDTVAVVAGDLFAAEGVHALLPAVALSTAPIHLLVIGSGPFREPLELLLHAMVHGSHDVFAAVVKKGWALDGSRARPLAALEPWLEGSRFAMLCERAAACRLEQRITFVGRLAEAERARLTRECDVAVLPAVVPETDGGPLVEAAAAGLRTIATEGGGRAPLLRELAEGGSLGRAPLVIPQEPARLVTALAEALELAAADLNPDALPQRGAVQTRGWPCVAQRVLAFYERAVVRSRAAS